MVGCRRIEEHDRAQCQAIKASIDMMKHHLEVADGETLGNGECSKAILLTSM